ncbi:hypothetical protein Tco_1197167 [Tanacetum coccineum]
MTDSSMSSTSDNKDLSDVELLLKAVDYDQSLQARSSPKELFQSCKQYGHVVDTFIPTKRSEVCVIMKCTCTIRQLAYATSPDALDEYLQMREHTERDSLDPFTKCVLELLMPEYLRKHDFNDTQKLYIEHNAVHGFSRMLGSIDCMH